MKNQKLDFVSVSVKILSVFVIMMFISCTPKKGNDLTNEKIKGHVQTIMSIEYEGLLKFGEFQKTGLHRVVKQTYNKFGNEIEVYDTRLGWKKIKKYDEKELKIEETTYNSNGTILDIIRSVYDDKNRLIEQNAYDEKNSLSEKSIFKYDDNGNQNGINVYEPDGSLASKYVFQWDNKNRLTEEDLIRSSPDLGGYRNKYKYTDNDVSVYEYNEYGLLIKKTIRKLDKNKNVIEIDEYYPEDLIQKTELTYDKFNNVISRTLFRSNNRKDISMYKYTYDAHDNWIAIDEFTNNEQTGKMERIITYF